jgi:hypothetical protein
MDLQSSLSPEDLAPWVERQTLRVLGSFLPRSVRARQIHEWQDQLECTRATNGDLRRELLQLVRSTPSIAWTAVPSLLRMSLPPLAVAMMAEPSIRLLALACASSVWLGWLAWRNIRPFTLAVAVLGLQLPLAAFSAGHAGVLGAAAGVGVGLLLGVVPILVAIAWFIAASSNTIARLPQMSKGVLPWGYTVWVVEATAICVWLDSSLLLILQAVASVALAWGIDRMHRKDSWWQTVATPWVFAETRRVAAVVAAMTVAVPIMLAYGLRIGPPEWQAASRYVTAALPVSSIDLFALVALIFASVAMVALAGEATRHQRSLVALRSIAPLCGWLLAAALLPPPLADYGVWGVLFSAVCLLGVLLCLWVEGHPEDSPPRGGGALG